jgi:F-type H+-transporting ATPase subunit delta
MAGDITTIARPYAEAVFARARESGQIDAWDDALSTLSAIAGNADMAEQISNPNVARERLCEAILGIAGDGLPTEARNLVKVLAESGRLAALPEIASLFEDFKTKQEGVRQVHIRSAFDLTDTEQRELAAALKKRLGAEVDMTVEKDPELIGGIEIRAGDLVIDGSVRGKLRKLAAELQF